MDTDKNNIYNKVKPFYFILTALAILAIITMIYSFGSSSSMPLFSTSLSFNEPQYMCFDSDNKLTSLTDDNQLRFSTFNKKEQVFSTQSFSRFSNQDDRYYNVVSDEDMCYVLHCQYDSNSGYVVLEELIGVDRYTNEKKCIFKQSYSPLVDQVRKPCIKDMRISDDDFYIVKLSICDANKIEVIKIRDYKNLNLEDSDSSYGFSDDSFSKDDIFENPNFTERYQVIQTAELPYTKNNILFAKYNIVCNKTIISTLFGELYQLSGTNSLQRIHSVDTEITFFDVCIDDFGNVFATDDISFDVYKIDFEDYTKLDIDVEANLIDIYNNNLVVSDENDNSVILYDTSNFKPLSVINNLPYDSNLKLFSILSSLSTVYLICLCIFLLIKLVVYFIKNVSKEVKKLCIFGLSGIFVILGICVTFINFSYIQAKDTSQQSLDTLCFLLSKTNVDSLLNIYDQSSTDKQSDGIRSYENILEYYNYANASGDNPTVDFDILTRKEMHNFSLKYDIDDSAFQNPDSSNLADFFLSFVTYAQRMSVEINNVQKDKNGQVEIISGEFDDDEGHQLFSASPVYSPTNVKLGFLSLASPVRQIVVQQIQKGVQLFFTLLVAACALVFIIMELINQLKAFKKAQAIKKHHTEGKTQLYAGRTLFFFSAVISSIDLSFCVLVVQDILFAQNIDNPGILLGLPTSLLFAGILIGTWLGMYLLPKKPARSILTVGSSVMIFTFIIVVFAVVFQHYWIFCISKIFIGCCCGTLTLVEENIQFQTKNPKMQAVIVNEIALGSLSAGALAGMFAGYLAQYIGDYAIYIICVFSSIMILLSTFYYIPKNVYFGKIKKLDEDKDIPGYKNNISVNNNKTLLKVFKLDNNFYKFIFSPKMISLFFLLIFVSIFAYQYLSILFPLFAQDSGLDKSQIGNITMLATCLVFAVNSVFKKALVTTNQRIIAVLSLVVMGFALICFAFNSTVFWIIISLFFILFGYRIASISYKLVWNAYADCKKINKSKVSFLVIFIRELSKLVTPLIITSLLFIGMVEICVLIGIICLIASVLFWIFTKKFDISSKKNS